MSSYKYSVLKIVRLDDRSKSISIFIQFLFSDQWLKTCTKHGGVHGSIWSRNKTVNTKYLYFVLLLPYKDKPLLTKVFG